MKGLSRAIKNMDKPLFVLTAILFVFGLLNIVSASSQTAVLKYHSALYSYFYRQLTTIIIGAIAGIFIIKAPTKSYKLMGPFFYITVLVVSLAVSFSSFGAEYSGNNNWINIKGFTFQPSEFAKPVMIICVALLFEKYHEKLKSTKVEPKEKYNMIGKILIVGLAFPIIIFLQKDIGTMLIITTIFFTLFLTGPIPSSYKLRTLALCGILGFIMILIYTSKGSVLSGAQKSRFDFFNPCSKYEEGGYQICNGFIAINSGGVVGNGIGNSKQISYIPESHTDSVFAIIAEQYGLITTTIIFILFAIILKRILNISMNSTSIKGRYICLGVATYIFLHILVNLGGLFGMMPLTGVPLPFLSYGGSFTISLICALSVVQRIAVENNLNAKKKN